MSGTLYARLGGNEAITAVADDLMARLVADSLLGRFWKDHGEDVALREKQLLIDFLCASTGGPIHYGGRDMKTSHEDLRITEDDWQVFMAHVGATLDNFEVPAPERSEVVAFIEGTKQDIVLKTQSSASGA